MKKIVLDYLNRQHSYTLAVTSVCILFGITVVLGIAGNGRAAPKQSDRLFFPIVHSNPRKAPVPDLVASIRLVGSRCPNDMAYDRSADILYIANEESDNVTIIRNNQFAGNISTGNWPIEVESDPNSNRVYLSHVLDGIRVLQDGVVVADIPAYSESYRIIVNSVNDYTYITDLHRPITIIRNYDKVKDLFVPDFQGNVIGWQLATDFDRQTGLTYFAGWEYPALTVVDGTEVIDQFSYEGLGASDMIVDSHRQQIVVANNLAYYDEESPNNISVIDMATKQVTSIFSARYSYRAALDPATGYVYVTNPDNNSVTVLQGGQEVATIQTGKKPREVAVDPVKGFAYVTNVEDNSISVFRDGLPVSEIELPQDKGFRPWFVTIDEHTGRVYILNRSTVEKDSSRNGERVMCRTPWVHILE